MRIREAFGIVNATTATVTVATSGNGQIVQTFLAECGLPLLGLDTIKWFSPVACHDMKVDGILRVVFAIAQQPQ